MTVRHTFDADGVRRIVDVVRASERQPINRPQKRGRYPVPTPLKTVSYFWIDRANQLTTPGTATAATNINGYPIDRPIDIDNSDFDTSVPQVLLRFGADLHGMYGHTQIVQARPAKALEKLNPDSDVKEFVVVSHGEVNVLGRVTNADESAATIWHSTGAEVSVNYNNLLGFVIEDDNVVQLTAVKPSPGTATEIIVTSVYCATGTGTPFV